MYSRDALYRLENFPLGSRISSYTPRRFRPPSVYVALTLVDVSPLKFPAWLPNPRCSRKPKPPKSGELYVTVLAREPPRPSVDEVCNAGGLLAQWVEIVSRFVGQTHRAPKPQTAVLIARQTDISEA